LGLVLFIKQHFTAQRSHYQPFRQVLNYRPRNLGLFQLAITHKSANRYSNNQPFNNERLEYLGDAVLNTVVADHLYHLYPHDREGFLTKMRSKIVSRETLNSVAKAMGLQQLIVSRLDDQQGNNVLGDALEALIGAIFLDAGFEKTRKYILHQLINKYIDVRKFECLTFDYKSQLIEWSQKNDMNVVFEDVEQDSNNPQQPVFVSKVKLHEEILGCGTGHSKKEAQQKAAKEAFDVYIEY
jgi:ribonuclease-3